MAGAAVLAVALLAGCGPAPDAGFDGYVEGDYRRIAAPEAGWLETLSVEEGRTVAAGDPLFTLESSRERAGVAEARANLAQALSQLADLRLGSRPEEIDAIEAQVEEARAGARLAEVALTRQRALAARDVAAQARLDEAVAAQRQARARLAHAEAELSVARLPARPDRIAAAEAAVDAARASVAQAEWRLAQRSIRSPAAALVDDVVRRPGEWVPANGAVVSLLPPEAVKLILFVPEPDRAAIRPGVRLEVRCDGCPAGLTARVRHVASDAEYTPPVIFSRETRAKLVFRVEAVPDGGALTPGQPVTVVPAAAS